MTDKNSEYFKKWLEEKFDSLEDKIDALEKRVFGTDSPLMKSKDCIALRDVCKIKHEEYDKYISWIRGGWWTALKLCGILSIGMGFGATIVTIIIKYVK